VLNFTVSLPVTLGIVYIWIFQINIIGRNTTSHEVSARRWAEFDAKNLKQVPDNFQILVDIPKPYRWPYDYGVFGNFKSVLGSSVLLWFFPTAPETDGITWKTNYTSNV
jgi:hypothetical protein